MKIYKIIKTVIKVITPIIGGKFIGEVTVKNARKDYRNNIKPPFSPPGYIFPIVWPILYITMGVAYGIVTNQSNRRRLKVIYYTQLSLNYLWSILYFKYKLRLSALVESVVLLGTVIITTVKFFNIKKITGFLLVPYVIWSAFATYLNAGNWLLNKDNPNYTGKIKSIKR
ncbi:TspO/MBR family protein [Staphylococcus epidermidis]|uniref:TspO/MBR family protein n=1 Tax=Staphylococcus epidermidis TaxID=1282 RepID=UPI000BDDA486|nr:TspO/MBR family protein [Staphylococcus epidermidis]MCG2076207.1 tryptophan-rich sensory protein [Staphylococcus epidermidis]MCG7828904.1 tryptophan-rich sensory protein [Staphylococcus epidermidis]MCM3102430.1 tryptophan-rich sensory protein [Staphylococcus epidermidis]PBJ84831.1 TspO protein [Staphylococcus epidermidis]